MDIEQLKMIRNRYRTNKLIVHLTIVISLLVSCNNCAASHYSDNKSITTTDAVDSQTDGSSWLKPSAGIRGIFEDSKGNLWFSSTEYVCRFDGSEFTYFTEKDGLKGNGMVHEDQYGTIWVESGFEAYSYDGKKFTSHPLKPDTAKNDWGASTNDIWFQKGIKLSGITEGPPGVYRYHKRKITFLTFPVPNTDNNDSRYHPTTRAIKGKDGTVWFGTMEAAIGFNKGKFTLIDREAMGRKDDPRPVGIRGLYVDKKGNLWLADNGAGIFVYDGKTVTNFTKKHKLDKGDRDGNTLHRAFAVAEDDAGNMWFGTVYSGVWRFDGKSFTNFTEKEGLTSDSIWTIYKTKRGELLFAGENPGAVYKFNGKSFDRVY